MALDGCDRQSVERLSAGLREATLEALSSRSPLARSLDELRCELERLLMIERRDPTEYRHLVMRGRMMLEAWRGMAAAAAPRR